MTNLAFLIAASDCNCILVFTSQIGLVHNAVHEPAVTAEAAAGQQAGRGFHSDHDDSAVEPTGRLHRPQRVQAGIRRRAGPTGGRAPAGGARREGGSGEGAGWPEQAVQRGTGHPAVVHARRPRGRRRREVLRQFRPQGRRSGDMVDQDMLGRFE